MNDLKWTSVLGVVTILMAVGVIALRYITNFFTPVEPSSVIVDRHVGDICWFCLSTDIFATMPTYSVAFLYHYNVPYFYDELQHRSTKVMMKAVVISFSLATLSYATAGLLGYLLFGQMVSLRAVGGNVINCFSSSDAVVNVVRVGLFFHFAVAYPILSVCARRGLHRTVLLLVGASAGTTADSESTALDSSRAVPPEGSPENTTRVAIVVEAFLIVASSVVIAGVVDGISTIIHVIGTVFGLSLIFIFPALIGLCVFRDSHCVADTQYTYFRATHANPTLWRLSCALLCFGVVFIGAGIAELILFAS
jgi:amino acid permease